MTLPTSFLIDPDISGMMSALYEVYLSRYLDGYDEAPPVDQYFTVPTKSLHVKHSMTCLHQNNKASLANLSLCSISYLPRNKSSLTMSHIIHLHHTQEDSLDIHYSLAHTHTHTHTTFLDSIHLCIGTTLFVLSRVV